MPKSELKLIAYRDTKRVRKDLEKHAKKMEVKIVDIIRTAVRNLIYGAKK